MVKIEVVVKEVRRKVNSFLASFSSNVFFTPVCPASPATQACDMPVGRDRVSG